MLRRVLTSFLLGSVVLVAQLPMSADVQAQGIGAEKEKKKRPTRLVGPSVGKKVAKAFELYQADDIPGALAILLDINAKSDYDKAYVDRFIGVMYAMQGKHEQEAIKYLKKAVEPDILNENDQAEALKLLADLQLQTKDYKNALKNYYAWMDFSGKEDAATWVKVANAYYELKQLDKMIEPANRAIALEGDKPTQNPYILKITSYYERKMYKEAVDVLETVLKLFPDNKTWWIQLGMFYTLVEDYPKALATLDMAYKQGYIEKESQIRTMASLFQSQGMPYKAAVLMEKGIAQGLVKRDETNLKVVANAWHAALHIDKAAKYYGELAKMTNSAAYYRKQGMLLKQDEQFEKAIVALKKALDLKAKGQGAIHMSLAESYFYLGKYKQAYASIQKAMEDPKTRRGAKGWVSFIKDTAQRKGVSI
jgi:tetratricopeptide (TPR) repeat protein